MSSSSILLNNSEPFLDWIVMCNKKWVVYDNWRWPVQCGWTEKLQSSSQSWTCTPKWSWSLFVSLLPTWSAAAFWIPVKPFHLGSMFSKSMRCTKNWNSCSHHWSTERAQFFCTTNLTSHGTTNASNIECIGRWSFASSIIFTFSPTTTSSSISKTFCREYASTTCRRQNMLSKSWSNPKAQIFMLLE